MFKWISLFCLWFVITSLGFPSLVFAKGKHHMAYSVQLASATIVMEASGEGEEGMEAVAFVLVNRVKDGRWGENLASVVLAPAQFSCWNTTDPNRRRIAEMKNDDPVLLKAIELVALAMDGSKPDPTQGATHYYSTTMAKPPVWAMTATFVVQIGKQRFYKDVK